MKFLVDTQLPQRLSHFLSKKGFDSRHILDLPNKNATSDGKIIRVADKKIVL